MHKEYIERGKVLQLAKHRVAGGEDRLTEGVNLILSLFEDFIKDIQAADVVEVVRCKDCKWFNEIGCAIGIVDDSDKPKEDDFCSYGERKDGAE